MTSTPYLLSHQAVRGNFIANDWVAPSQWMEAITPIDDTPICEIPDSSAAEVNLALEAATTAATRMRALSIWDRSRLCRRIADQLESHSEELARLVTIDQGKPIAEATAEVIKAVEGFANAAEMVKWLEGRVIPAEDPGKLITTRYVPKGVQAVVTPWNFPVNIPVEYIAPGLAAGNAIVWVPAPSTSVCAARLADIMAEADLPAGALNMVIGRGMEAGAALVSDARVNVVGFTGSAATGLAIARAAAGKPMLLELGGNGPVVVLEDADLELAAKGALFGAFFNAGQTCAASGRIIVDRNVHDQFVELLLARAAEVKAANPLNPTTDMGPLNNAAVFEKVQMHLQDARKAGSKVRGGNPLPQMGSLYMQPAVVTHVREDSLLNIEETFGPVAPVLLADGLDDALRITNQNSYGLAAAIFTRDIRSARQFADEAQCGLAVVNDSSLYWELHIPFGGASGKRSGIGRIGGADTIKALSDTRTMAMGVG